MQGVDGRSVQHIGVQCEHGVIYTAGNEVRYGRWDARRKVGPFVRMFVFDIDVGTEATIALFSFALL